MSGQPDTQQAEAVDRCPACLCGDCGGPLALHTGTGCSCPDCSAWPEVACTTFVPEQRIGYLAEQLGPLLSSHLNERAARRCLAVAHAAHHALLDYDHQKETAHA